VTCTTTTTLYIVFTTTHSEIQKHNTHRKP